MGQAEKLSSYLEQAGIQGTLMGLVPLPFAFACLNNINAEGSPYLWPCLWRIFAALISSVFCLICSFILFRRPAGGKILGALASIFSFTAAFPYLAGNPFAALLACVAIISSGFAIIDFKPRKNFLKQADNKGICLQRARHAAFTIPVIAGFSLISGTSHFLIVKVSIAASGIIAQMLFIHWAWKGSSKKFSLFLTSSGLLLSLFSALSVLTEYTHAVVLITFLLTFFLLPRSMPASEKQQPWWETLVNHPARVLLITFLGLCSLGTLMLIIPWATREGSIGLVDSAFTSVSAVCVTGLVVLDTGRDFTILGQFFILVLIQSGGLGIMTITTVALHAMGRRLSLRQEGLMTRMTDTDYQNLLSSLILIVKFTFAMEFMGTLILTGLFYPCKKSLMQSLWCGIFTSVSAFCNAGFALQTDNLLLYQKNPMILHTIAMLIIFGGMAPAANMMIPRWVRRKRIPVSAFISLMTTAVLLLSGIFFILSFEWNGILSELSIMNKIHNAWFQSVTLRTAGFNSVDISSMSSPAFLVMLCLMFIGGSPGGTAGGIKTTTAGVLALTFWSKITNRNAVIIKNRIIRSDTVYQAITIVFSFIFLWFVVVLMLEVTQGIPAREIIFEATSAIGTVGLSTGATPSLDEIGKIIIMMAMFAGRIGPMTLFMLLSEDKTIPVSRCPDAKITLT